VSDFLIEDGYIYNDMADIDRFLDVIK